MPCPWGDPETAPSHPQGEMPCSSHGVRCLALGGRHFVVSYRFIPNHPRVEMPCPWGGSTPTHATHSLRTPVGGGRVIAVTALAKLTYYLIS